MQELLRIAVDGQPVVDAPEWRLDEPELVDARVGRERADEADVRPFWGLDRADPAVVAVVDVADVEPGPLAAESTGTERVQAPLVRELGERVDLVHELRQRAGAEELLDRRDNWPGVDQRRRGDRVGVGDRHPLLDDPLHADQAHPELVLEQLADGAHPAVAEVVDVVRDLLVAGRVVQLEQLAQDGDQVTLLEDAEVLVADALLDLLGGPAEALVDLVAADAAEVEAAAREEEALEQGARVVDARRIARADAAVQLEQGVVRAQRRVLVERRLQVRVLGVVVDVAEQLLQGTALGIAVAVGAGQARQLEGLQQRGHRDLALAVES